LALQASESLNELNRVEAQLLHQLSSWKQEPNFVAVSREKFEGSVSEFNGIASGTANTFLPSLRAETVKVTFSSLASQR
jgi:hypothetical protein